MADSNNTNPQDGGNATQGVAAPTGRTFWETVNPGYIVAGISTALLSLMSITRNEHKILRELKINKPYYDLASEVAQEHFAVPHESDKQAMDSLKALYKDTLDKKGLNALMKLVDSHAHENLEAHGVENNVLSAWNKVLKRHHKLDVVLKVATVASFAIGAIYSFTRERHLAERIHSQMAQTTSRIQRRVDQDTGSLSQQIADERQQQPAQGQSR